MLDFYCTKVRLGIEVDGSIHDSIEARARDAERTRRIEAYNIKIIRIRNEEVYRDIGSVLKRIADCCQQLHDNK